MALQVVLHRHACRKDRRLLRQVADPALGPAGYIGSVGDVFLVTQVDLAGIGTRCSDRPPYRRSWSCRRRSAPAGRPPRSRVAPRSRCPAPPPCRGRPCAGWRFSEGAPMSLIGQNRLRRLWIVARLVVAFRERAGASGRALPVIAAGYRSRAHPRQVPSRSRRARCRLRILQAPPARPSDPDRLARRAHSGRGLLRRP